MTIIVAGGAGSDGKTTVLELLAKYRAAEGKHPLIIDANPDQLVDKFMGVAEAKIKDHLRICNHFDWLKEQLEAGNPDYPNLAHVVDTSPVTQHSRRWQLADDDAVLQKFTLEKDGVRLMQTGTYEASDLGGSCMHGKIAPLIFMLQRLYDGKAGEQGLVLVDNAHGRDAFGTSLYAQGDAVLVVARPDMKSAEILKDYLSMANEVSRKIKYPVTVFVVGNRLSSDPAEFAEEEAFLRNIAGEAYSGSLREDPALKRKFSNEGPTLDKLSQQNYQAIAAIAGKLDTAGRIPERRKVWMELCHGKAGVWQDVLKGTSISAQKTDFVPDKDEAHACTNPHHHHVHGPHCRH